MPAYTIGPPCRRASSARSPPRPASTCCATSSARNRPSGTSGIPENLRNPSIEITPRCVSSGEGGSSCATELCPTRAVLRTHTVVESTRRPRPWARRRGRTSRRQIVGRRRALDPYQRVMGRTTMKRRAFLATIGASTAAAALWPSLIRRAFADASFDAPGAKKTAPGLSTNAKHIDPSKRPQLVIVIPADDGQKYRRGEMWGEYLNHGEPSQLAPLAHVDVSCATMAELGALAKDVKGEPLAILFSQGGGVRVLDATLPEYNVGRRFDPKNDDAIVDKRIAVMSKMVAGAL